MIIGTGIDIISNERIRKILTKFPSAFLKKIFSQKEIEILQTKFLDIYSNKAINFIAKRFAAKEAFAKATGLGIGGNFSFTDIQILNSELGKPFILLDNKKKFTNIFNQSQIYLTISDERDYSVAMVIIEKL
jgi:holo-[acyl-carrier protein] synthase